MGTPRASFGQPRPLARPARPRYHGVVNAARKLLAEALQLDDEARATLALELMDSLSPPDPRDEASWIDTIERRALRAMSGAEPGVEVDVAVDRVAHDLGL